MSESLLTFVDNPFWQFSLKTYSHEPVKNHCLKLQQEFDFNVNLLLFCCWLANQNIELARDQFNEAIASTQHWHSEVTKPLRSARAFLAQNSADRWVSNYYKQLLATELHSESFQQQQLYRYVKDAQKLSNSDPKQQFAAYLQWLVEHMNLPMTPSLQSQLNYLVDLTILH